MGAGSWSADAYHKVRATNLSVGRSAFHYSDTTMAAPAASRKIFDALDPKGIKTVRECRDSDDHPLSKGLALFFDQTGSMHSLPKVFQEKLDKLMTMVKVKSGLDDLQMLFGAIGDAHNREQFPFQVGQFEADNRADEQLTHIILEGQGGGSSEESYDLAYFWAGHMVALDSLEKRGEKGYMFTVGDEKFYPNLSGAMIEQVFGRRVIQDDHLSFQDILAKAQENFECFHLHCRQGNHGTDEHVIGPWRDLLGQRLVFLDDGAQICEVVAGIVAGCEGLDLSTLGTDLYAVANTVETAVTAYRGAKPAKATVTGDLPAPVGAGAARV